MKKTWLTLCAISMLAVCLWAALAQHRTIVSLRSQRTEILARLAEPNPGKSHQASTAIEPGPANSGAGAVSPELLKARSEVTRLAALKRQLAGVEQEHATLEAQLARVATNTAGRVALPEGYILRKNAQRLGFATPENAVQTFLWAIENGDTNTLFRALTPEAAREFEMTLRKSGESAEEVFRQMKLLPGLCILNRKEVNATTTEFSVIIVPDMPSQTMQLRLIDGEWRMRPF